MALPGVLVARQLEALANYPAKEDEHYYLKRSDGNLVEQTHDGTEWSLPSFIAAISPESGATYTVVSPEIRLIIFVGQAETLQSYKYSVDDDEWTQGSLIEYNIKTHPKSKVTTSLDKASAIHIYYQDESGNLAEAEGTASEGKVVWRVVGPLASAKPKIGTPLHASNKEDKIHLYYQSEDGSIHDHSTKYGSGKWEDRKIGPLIENTSITALTVREFDDETGIYSLHETGKISYLTSSGKAAELVGTVTKEGFKANTSAECFFFSQNITYNYYNVNVYNNSFNRYYF